jgi:hypothetical protein
MAIIVEEEKKRTNIAGLLGWLGILIVIAVAVYYVFFAAPELVIIQPSGSLSSIAPIANISLNPTDITNSPSFQALHATIPPLNPAVPAPGRSDPFLTP